MSELQPERIVQKEVAGVLVNSQERILTQGQVKDVLNGGHINDPEFLKDADAEMLQDMLITGINSAIEQSKKLQEEQMNSITGGLTSGLSGLGLGF